jgi:hypothetical protein
VLYCDVMREADDESRSKVDEGGAFMPDCHLLASIGDPYILVTQSGSRRDDSTALAYAKGCGLVEYSSAAEARAAIEELTVRAFPPSEDQRRAYSIALPTQPPGDSIAREFCG